MVDKSLRNRISNAITEALRPLPIVFAGWEGGSAAFGGVDEYSDIDLTYLVADDASFELLYASAEHALETVSSITGSHDAPPGRYYMLKDGGEFFLVDLSFLLAGAPDHYLEVERHGRMRSSIRQGKLAAFEAARREALASKRMKRFRELQDWFIPSQSFPRAKRFCAGSMRRRWAPAGSPLSGRWQSSCACATVPCAGTSACATSIVISRRPAPIESETWPLLRASMTSRPS